MNGDKPQIAPPQQKPEPICPFLGVTPTPIKNALGQVQFQPTLLPCPKAACKFWDTENKECLIILALESLAYEHTPAPPGNHPDGEAHAH